MKPDLETSSWPPKEGEIVYFETGSGVQKGGFAKIHRGLLWVEYWLDDGRVIAEHDLVMCPRSTPWRDPATVSESENQESCNRIKAVLASETCFKRGPRFRATGSRPLVSRSFQWCGRELRKIQGPAPTTRCKLRCKTGSRPYPREHEYFQERTAERK
jgi:hypothetical protein